MSTAASMIKQERIKHREQEREQERIKQEQEREERKQREQEREEREEREEKYFKLEYFVYKLFDALEKIKFKNYKSYKYYLSVLPVYDSFKKNMRFILGSGDIEYNLYGINELLRPDKIEELKQLEIFNDTEIIDEIATILNNRVNIYYGDSKRVRTNKNISSM